MTPIAEMTLAEKYAELQKALSVDAKLKHLPDGESALAKGGNIMWSVTGPIWHVPYDDYPDCVGRRFAESEAQDLIDAWAAREWLGLHPANDLQAVTYMDGSLRWVAGYEVKHCEQTRVGPTITDAVLAALRAERK